MARRSNRVVIVGCNAEAHAFTQRLEGSLKAPGLGLDVWTDREISQGDMWDLVIREAIESASSAIVLLTPASSRSQYLREVELPMLLEPAREGLLTLIPAWVTPGHDLLALSSYPGLNPSDRPLADMPAAELEQRLAITAEWIADRARGARGSGKSPLAEALRSCDVNSVAPSTEPRPPKPPPRRRPVFKVVPLGEVPAPFPEDATAKQPEITASPVAAVPVEETAIQSVENIPEMAAAVSKPIFGEIPEIPKIPENPVVPRAADILAAELRAASAAQAPLAATVAPVVKAPPRRSRATFAGASLLGVVSAVVGGFFWLHARAPQSPSVAVAVKSVDTASSPPASGGPAVVVWPSIAPSSAGALTLPPALAQKRKSTRGRPANLRSPQTRPAPTRTGGDGEGTALAAAPLPSLPADATPPADPSPAKPASSVDGDADPKVTTAAAAPLDELAPHAPSPPPAAPKEPAVAAESGVGEIDIEKPEDTDVRIDGRAIDAFPMKVGEGSHHVILIHRTTHAVKQYSIKVAAGQRVKRTLTF